MAISAHFRFLSAKFPSYLQNPNSSISKTLISLTPPLIPPKPPISRSVSFERVPTKPQSSSSSQSASVSVQNVEDLPPKLQEIVNLFQSVKQPKAKYEQLLFYGKNLTPLDSQFKTSENKVQGCVSQVWVRAFLDEHRNVRFEADSDSVLTKGLAALLVQGLSGRPVEEILRVSPDFVLLLGLQQSLTPSRNNGFLNMLKLMQRKAFQLYVEAERGGGSVVESSSEDRNSVPSSTVSSEGVTGVEELKIRTHNSGSNSENHLGSRAQRIRERLEMGLCPTELVVEDTSYQHSGHDGVRGSEGETHFNVKVVSKEFEGKSSVKRHRLVYGLLQEELNSGLHALSIIAKTPSEAGGTGTLGLMVKP